MCFVARGVFEVNKKVIGIATEMKLRPACSYDFCLLVIPELTKQDRHEISELQCELGILMRPRIGKFHEEEYPTK